MKVLANKIVLRQYLPHETLGKCLLSSRRLVKVFFVALTAKIQAQTCLIRHKVSFKEKSDGPIKMDLLDNIFLHLHHVFIHWQRCILPL